MHRIFVILFVVLSIYHIPMFKTTMKKLGTLNVFDWAIFKICLVAGAFTIATLIPVIVTVKWWIYAIIRAVMYLYVLWRLFIKK